MQSSGQPRVEIVVPVKNEEHDLGPNIRRLREFLDTAFPYRAEVCIADNGSTDATYEIGVLLALELPGVRVLRIEEVGRGRALKQVWSESTADVLAYMDVDLSTNLNALLPLVAPLFAGHSDVAIGTRLSNGSRVVRRPKREFISRSYNLLLRATLSTHFSDAQCGFKAIRADVARELLPLVEDTSWFFDTELLVLAERAGLRIHEVPVDWIDDLDSRVAIARTVAEDLRGIARLARSRPDLEPIRQVYGRPRVLDPRTAFAARALRFCAVGVLSTVAYALLYLVLRQGMPAQVANVLALLITAVGNTALNRRITFGVRGVEGRWRHQLRGLVTFGIGWSLTACSLWLLHTAVAVPHQAVEVVVLTLANLAATIVRFTLFQAWVFDDDAPTLPTLEPQEQLTWRR
ncbi:bifunctional glycosyltransferase family 2/GtrA family protein [Kribbella sandramycini]|uniref:dolichyl-phosphate beta-glucosyltransferase n=1 Tax=Kribbella sandramycini TaxID=60450 RepID=A0A7Y4KZA0_9ACTN|nr:bifunctional glycosyltransferase family 2/GtrA family protein [Kribbella sandramycini]MBB6565140.1 putative flippase GtrA [Kribbella sandramycini]NOL41409.1 bifunctional glycosyltransferase family 2/GtrA family protein [Kribbella sandramycini]